MSRFFKFTVTFAGEGPHPRAPLSHCGGERGNRSALVRRVLGSLGWSEGKSNRTGERFRHSLPGVRMFRSGWAVGMAHQGRIMDVPCLSTGDGLAGVDEAASYIRIIERSPARSENGKQTSRWPTGCRPPRCH